MRDIGSYVKIAGCNDGLKIVISKPANDFELAHEKHGKTDFFIRNKNNKSVLHFHARIVIMHIFGAMTSTGALLLC
jgi:hypothetical protein